MHQKTTNTNQPIIHEQNRRDQSKLKRSDESKQKKIIDIFLPGYLSINFHDISNPNAEDEQNAIKKTFMLNCDMEIIFNVKGLTNEMIEHVRSNTFLSLKSEEALALNQNATDYEVEVEEFKEKSYGNQCHYLKFVVKKEYSTHLDDDPYYFPFDTFRLILTVSPFISSLYSLSGIEDRKHMRKDPDDKNLYYIKFRINLMDTEQRRAKIDYDLNKTFGTYAIASKKLKVQYTKDSIASLVKQNAKSINEGGVLQKLYSKLFDKNQSKINHEQFRGSNKISEFKYAHFYVELYNIPISFVSTFFLPLLLLSVLNLGIYFQISDGVSGRIENMAALLFAFFSILQVVREVLPKTHKFTVAEIHVFLLIGTTLLCLIETVYQREAISSENAAETSAFFIVSACISSWVFFLSAVMLIAHYCYFQKQYIEKQSKSSRSRVFDRFVHYDWSNQQCDTEFIGYFDKQQIQSLEDYLKQSQDNDQQSSDIMQF